MVLENVKAASDLKSALASMRRDISATEKEFARLKAQFDKSGDTDKYASNLKKVGDTLRGLISDYQEASGGAKTFQDANDAMTASIIDGGLALNSLTDAKKQNVEASLAEKDAIDNLSVSMQESIKLKRKLALADANRKAAKGDKDAFKDLKKDPLFSKEEVNELETQAADARFKEGIFQTEKRITGAVNDRGELIREEASLLEQNYRRKLQDKKATEKMKVDLKETLDDENDRFVLAKKMAALGKKNLGTSTQNVNDPSFDLKNFQTKAGFDDIVSKASIAELKEFKKGLSENGKAVKEIDAQIDKLTQEQDELTKSVNAGVDAEERMFKARQRRKELGVGSAKQDAEDRQKEVDGLKTILKRRKELSGETSQYYSISKQGTKLEQVAAHQLNKELLEQARLRIQDKAALKGLDRRRKIQKEIREELEDINRLKKAGMLADTKEGNRAEAARLSGLAKERERLQLGVGESFKANLNEPAMRASRAMREVGQGMQDAGRQALMFSAVLLSSTIPALKVFADFNQEVQNVVSVLGEMSDTEAEDTLDRLSTKFLDLGEKTEFTANQIAAAAKALALAGFSGTEVIESIEAVTNLASAGNLDLEQTAGYFSNIVRAFDVDTSNAERVADVLSVVATNSNTTIETLGESFKFIAPIASATGQSLEEVSAALGVLGNAGISASRAGTGLSRAFSELLEKQDEFSEILEGIGSSYDRIDPTRRTVTEIVSELERLKAAGLLTTTGFFEMFDQRSARAVLTLVNQGADAVEDLGEKANNSAGAADRIKEIRLDTLSGDLLKLQSSFNSLQITLGELFGDTARDVVQSLTRMTKAFREFANTAFGGFMIKASAMLITILGTLVGTGGLFALTVGGLVRMAAAFSTARTVIAASAGTIKEFGGVLNLVKGSLTATTQAAANSAGPLAAMASSSSGASAGFMGLGISAGTAMIAIGALVAAIALLVGAYYGLSAVQSMFEDAFADKNRKRVEDLSKTVDGFSSSIRKAANSLELIRKLPDLNLTQLRELTQDDNLFKLDIKEIEKGLGDAIQSGLNIASREATTNMDTILGGFTTWDGWTAGFRDMWAVGTQPLYDGLSAIGNFATLNFREGADDIGNYFKNTFKAIARLNPAARTVSAVAEPFAGTSGTRFEMQYNEETRLNDIYMTRFDIMGDIRTTQIELSELSNTQQDALMAAVAASEQLKKAKELELQRSEMIEAFDKGRAGLQQWRLKLKEKERVNNEEIARLEELILTNQRNGLTEAAERNKLDLQAVKEKGEELNKNIEMADRAAKSSEAELKSTTAIMRNQVEQGKHMKKVNELDREITELKIRQAHAQEDGNNLSQQELLDLQKKEDLRKRYLDLLDDERAKTEDLLETQYKITENEKRRIEIIEGATKSRKSAKDAAKKTEEELEDSEPIGTDAEGNPIFRTPEQEKELQRKRAKEKQVGTISPEQARKELEKKLGFDGFDPSIELTPEQREEFQKELQKVIEGTSEDIGSVGEFGGAALGSMLEFKFATGRDSETYIEALEQQVKDLDQKKKDALNIKRNEQENETIEEFEYRKNRAEKEVRKLEEEERELNQKIKRAKQAKADGGKAIQDKVDSDLARRKKQAENLDKIDANTKAKEAEEERKKAAEDAKKEKEREDKEREKLFNKKKEALAEAELEDKKRELKMAKLNKNKKQEETLTEEIAKIERQRAADRKFGTDEELKELKKDKNMTAEQEKILNETIANKAKFIKEEEELFKAEKKAKKEQKKDEQIEDLNKKAQKQEEKRLSTQEKIRDAMLKQAKSLRDVVLITKFLNRQEAIRKMAQEKARKKAVNSGSNLAKILNDPDKSEKQKQSAFSKAARNLRQAKELGISDLELQNLRDVAGKYKDSIMNSATGPTPSQGPVVPPNNQPVNNPVNQNGGQNVQGGGVVNNVANPNVIFNLAGIKDPDQFMNFIGNNAKKITEALFTKGGQQRAKNQGKNTNNMKSSNRTFKPPVPTPGPFG